jgi:transcriptional regulator with XRE-family HTH domain
MKDFGKRLKEERERLCLSQAEFAKDCGVGKTAQYMYEKGNREPSLSYINEARKSGADVLYILTGERSGNDLAYARAASSLLLEIEILLGLKEGRMPYLCYQRVELEEQQEIENLSSQNKVSFLPWIENVKEWLLTSTNPGSCLDLDLFTSVLAEIEFYVERAGIKLATDKKVKVLIMLYQIFKASGEVDNKMLAEVIMLASS